MAEEPDVIREQIEETRSALTEKLETLEGQVRETVQSAKETVEGTIETVRSSVQETVASVKRTFDLEYQVKRHPWAMLGGSLLTGFVLGRYVQGQRQAPRHLPRAASYAGLAPESDATYPPSGSRLAAPSAPAFAAEPSRPSRMSQFLHTFDDEIDKVKGLAVGAAMGLVRDLAKESFPKLAPQIEDVLNSATIKLGGQPIAGPLLEPTETTRAAHQFRGRHDVWQ